jgi:hypothetical protein
VVGSGFAKCDGDIHEQISQVVLELNLLEADLLICAVLLNTAVRLEVP